jgi:YegS/Rv2252/BmrU family lipid kinase
VIAVIVNPLSGSRSADRGAARLALARRLTDAEGIDARIHVSRHSGHAVELTAEAVAGGATLVCAWGGDGTVNEVARVLAGTDVALGVIPEGSGNGFARELGLYRPPKQALAVALGGRERMIDAGMIGGRPFFNVAGVGFDARIAALFNARGASRRGFWRYIALGWRELITYRADWYRLDVDGDRLEARALMVVLANLRQYGNNARIAPRAEADDGRLELVVVGVTSALRAFLLTPRLFVGGLDRVRGIEMRACTRVTIASDAPLLCHADGEVIEAGSALVGTVTPRVLRVRVAEEPRPLRPS